MGRDDTPLHGSCIPLDYGHKIYVLVAIVSPSRNPVIFKSIRTPHKLLDNIGVFGRGLHETGKLSNFGMTTENMTPGPGFQGDFVTLGVVNCELYPQMGW